MLNQTMAIVEAIINATGIYVSNFLMSSDDSVYVRYLLMFNIFLH